VISLFVDAAETAEDVPCSLLSSRGVEREGLKSRKSEKEELLFCGKELLPGVHVLRFLSVVHAENSEAEKGIPFVWCTIDWVRNSVLSWAFRDDGIYLAFKDDFKDGFTLAYVLEASVFVESATDISEFTSIVFICRS